VQAGPHGGVAIEDGDAGHAIQSGM
jgi:hypothetical protein